jgi:type II secretory pathway pseudopilin PulG
VLRVQTGFTLVELLVAQAMGLALLAALTGGVTALYHAVLVASDAARTSETAYFLMDALEQWVSEAKPITSQGDVRPDVIGVATFHDDSISLDPCQTPVTSTFNLARAGVMVVPVGALHCISQTHVSEDSVALVIEKREGCESSCLAPGFFTSPGACGQENYLVRWQDRGNHLEACEDGTQITRLSRLIVYSRDYSWRVGDGIPAIMVAELAPEADARWLRSTMLASGIAEWWVGCLGKGLTLQTVACDPAGIFLNFTTNGRYASIRVERHVALLGGLTG